MIEQTLKNYPLTDNAKRESNRTIEEAQPFLQWVGGKREFINSYSDYLPTEYSNYHEPFLGGGAVMFHLKAGTTYASDSNAELVDTYLAIKNAPQEVIEILEHLKSKHSKDLYYEIRALDRIEGFQNTSESERAARMIYLNQTGFNGVYRVNRKGQYNVPIGSSLNRLICDAPTLMKCSEFLQNVNLEHRDYQTVLDHAEAGDFIYLDPPYAPAGEYSDFVRYTKEQFSLNDQRNVRDVFKELDSRGCKVALANADVALIRDLYSDYEFLPVLSSRNLSSNKETRGKVGEVLVVNYEKGEK